MYACMYVCMYVCIATCIHVRIHISFTKPFHRRFLFTYLIHAHTATHRYVLVSGEKSQRLSIYETTTGHAVSRGQLAKDVSQVAVGQEERGEEEAAVLIADRQGKIVRLKAFYG